MSKAITGITAEGEIWSDLTPDKALDIALNLPSTRQPSLRSDLANGLRLSLGTQIHSSCLAHIEPQRPIKEIKTALESWLKKSILKIVNCRDQYEELKEYTDSWLKQMRQAVIFCTQKGPQYAKTDPRYINWNAVAIYHKDQLRNYLTTEEFRAIEPSIEVDAKQERPAFIFSQARFNDALKIENNESINTLIHEGFHQTQLNNLTSSRHEEVQSIPANKKGKCREDITMDRILVVSTLCSGEKIATTIKKENKGESSTLNILLEKKTFCGNHRCLDLFTNQESSSFFSKGLTHSLAKDLCNKIYEDSKCLQTERTQEALSKGSSFRLKHLTPDLFDRISNIYPSKFVKIPSVFFQLFPLHSQQLEKLKNGLSSPCLSPFFKFTSNGDFIVTPMAIKMYQLNYKEWNANLFYDANFIKKGPSLSETIQTVFDRILLNILSIGLIKRPVSCSYKQYKNDFKLMSSFFSTYQEAADQLFNSCKLMQMATDRSLGINETIYSAENFMGMIQDQSCINSMKVFLGEVLAKKYLHTLIKHHPLSPLYICTTTHEKQTNAKTLQTITK